MKLLTLVVRIGIVLVIVSAFVVSGGELKSPLAGGQAPVIPGLPTPGEVDLTPVEKSVEVQQLLKGRRFTPDSGEPAGAIKAYLVTQEKVRKAMRRIEAGPLPGEADFDPDQLLNEALTVRRQATALYPTSRHAWQGLGDVFWYTYVWQHRSADLRGAVDAYTKATELVIPKGPHGPAGSDFAGFVTRIASGLAALSDVATLDAFFGRLRATDLWGLARHPYAVALGTLNDPRADRAFQELLPLVTSGETLPDYIDYLWDRGRYFDALRILDMKAQPYAVQRAQRGAILERLGRMGEAEAEYQRYFQDSAKGRSWGFFSVPDRYRIPGSPLQQKIKFRPDGDRLPKPESSLRRFLAPASAWAFHVPAPCASDDWFCLARYYLVKTIHGEAGCIDTHATCWGTVGGQRAVAWNIRTRVFGGIGFRVCFGATQVCFNPAPQFPLGSESDMPTLARRYYYVIDQGVYEGLEKPMSLAQELEAEANAVPVIVEGSVPDPMAGACLAGGPTGDICSGGCSQAKGNWGAFLAHQSGIEFRGGVVKWQTATNSTCQWEELVPSGTAGGTACGTQCYYPVTWGAICPRFGLLRRMGCVSNQSELGPMRGNFYWRFWLPGVSDPIPPPISRDFNRDWKADILWRHSSGLPSIWMMNGIAITGSGNTPPVTTDWQVAGVADFDGDGRADILWRYVTGAMSIWMMNGATVTANGSLPSVATDWHVAGVGDFNGDGKADILWRHTSGLLSVWLMNGTVVTASGSPGSVAADWRVAGVADFNRDKKADILWQHTSGVLSLWWINGTTLLGSDLPGTRTADWQVARVGDFNGDGETDILWRNTGSGAVSMWLMYGASLMSEGVVATVGNDWTIAGVNDFNGDGQADVLWRHTSGSVVIWLMSGLSVSGGGTVGSAGTDWQIQ